MSHKIVSSIIIFITLLVHIFSHIFNLMWPYHRTRASHLFSLQYDLCLSMVGVTPGHRGDRLKIITRLKKKKNRYLTSCFLGENVLFKESPPNIMVTRNLDWSTEILWYKTVYVKWKILLPLKRPAWSRLHCWFCHKLLTFCWFMLWWFARNIPDSDASEYSTTNTFNSSIGKYYVAIYKKIKLIFFYSWL